MIKDKNKFFMQEAYAQAKKALALDEIPIGAVVVLDDNIIGRGFNQSIHKSDSTAHAEIIAIQKAGEKINNYRLVDCDLFVTLEPCLMCLGAILHARIRNVYFAASDIKTGACGGLIDLTINNSLNHHCNFHKGILSKESTDLIQNFFQEKRAKKNRT
jgi:tRNA(adenine34) deaminase